LVSPNRRSIFNFELAVQEALPQISQMVVNARQLNHQLSKQAMEGMSLGRALFGSKWNQLKERIAGVQAVPRL
jgi:hypothetical protein